MAKDNGGYPEKKCVNHPRRRAINFLADGRGYCKECNRSFRFI